MGSSTSRLISMTVIAFLSVLIIWIICGTTVAGIQFRKTTMTSAAIDDINNTISSYIQKNGGYFNDTAEGQKARKEFEDNLIALHQFDKAGTPGCKECVDINVTSENDVRGKVQRSTVYTINIKYNYLRSTFSVMGFDYGWVPGHPRVSKAYVHRYINDGEMTK